MPEDDAEHGRDVTALLDRASTGDDEATAELVGLLFDELKRAARAQLRRDRAGHTLQTTALVHEAWLRLTPDEMGRAESRGDFLRYASRAMRSVLIDYARRRKAEKRGGGEVVVALDDEMAHWRDKNIDLLDLEDCLRRLEAKDAQLAQLVDLRYFGGLTEVEAADVLGQSRRQVQNAWTLARAWLHRELAVFAEPKLP